MDSFAIDTIEEIWFVKPTQIGGTEAILNMILYAALQDPGPSMIVEPTQNLAEEISRDRVDLMINTCDALREIKSQIDDDITKKRKVFSSMTLYFAWSNSPTSLASRPIRYCFFDEVNKYNKFTGEEASPLSLGKERTNTFIFTRKVIYISTPTTDSGYITMGEESCDARFRYHITCPHCGHMQPLVFDGVQFSEFKVGLQEVEARAYYACENCKGKIFNDRRMVVVKSGKWVDIISGLGFDQCIKELRPKRIGFQINRLYSPWHSFGMVAREFLESKDFPEKLMNWRNSWMAEPWIEHADSIESDTLNYRKDEYGPKIPTQAGVLTASIDVQDDRLEAFIIAWGRKEEAWAMDYKQFLGNPAQPEIWDACWEYLQENWNHELGGPPMHIRCICVDTGGHFTTRAYDFVRPKQVRGVLAIKGSSQASAPLVRRPTESNIGKVKLFVIGTDTAKQIIYARLKIQTSGPGFIHFPKGNLAFDEEYFKQLTAERSLIKHDKAGFSYRIWEKKNHPRNEALDLMVYAFAALKILNINLDSAVSRIEENSKPTKEDLDKMPSLNPVTQRPRGTWVKGW